MIPSLVIVCHGEFSRHNYLNQICDHCSGNNTQFVPRLTISTVGVGNWSVAFSLPLLRSQHFGRNYCGGNNTQSTVCTTPDNITSGHGELVALSSPLLRLQHFGCKHRGGNNTQSSVRTTPDIINSHRKKIKERIGTFGVNDWNHV